jgi:hypothetical protein
MSVHVTAEALQTSVTSVPVILTLNNNTKIKAIKVQAWEIDIDAGEVYEIALHYENALTNVWIDIDTIIDVAFLEVTGGDSPTWFTDGTNLYYWQGGSFYNADGTQYFGSTTNFGPLTTTNNTTISESWAFSLAYEVNTSTFTYAPITKAVKITNTGTLVIRYYRGTVEIYPELVEDVIPATIYRWDSIALESGTVFDSRAYPHMIAGCSIALYQRRKRRGRDGQMIPAGNVVCTWYNGADVRKTETWVRNEVININAEGGQESIDKDFVVGPNGGSQVEVRLRIVHYPIVAASPAIEDDQAFADLAATVEAAV